jgi:uncharacterized lipoprotein
MKDRRIRSLGIAFLFAMPACGTIVIGDGDVDEGRTKVLAGVSFDEAWEAAIATFEALRIPIDELDRSSGVITTDWELIEQPDEAMDCPSEADRNAEGRFNVFVREVAEGVRVTVNASFRAEDNTGRRVICRSQGEFEEDFVLLIEERA